MIVVSKECLVFEGYEVRVVYVDPVSRWLMCSKVDTVWQVYVYILLKANPYDDDLGKALRRRSPCDPSMFTRWIQLVLRADNK